MKVNAKNCEYFQIERIHKIFYHMVQALIYFERQGIFFTNLSLKIFSYYPTNYQVKITDFTEIVEKKSELFLEMPS